MIIAVRLFLGWTLSGGTGLFDLAATAANGWGWWGSDDVAGVTIAYEEVDNGAGEAEEG